MKPSQLYLDRVEKIKKTTVLENESVTTCYMGQATPAEHMGVTMADYANDPDLSLDIAIDYINEINEVAPIDCANTSPGTNKPNIGLATAWLSRIKMPGRELPIDSLWQVEEKKIMEDSDYDLVIEKGTDALTQKIYPQIFDMKEYKEFGEYMAQNGQKRAEKLVENDYPVVNGGFSSPPFEMLCGGRSMSQFFMDCYKMPDKVEAAINAMLPTSIEGVVTQCKQGNAYGAWVGGWRGASALVSPKIWDKLVWPSMYKIGMALIENGFVPTFHLDQNWDRDIERFLELPAKKFIINTDGMTDLRSLRKKLGDHCAVMGDVPAQLLATGTPEQVTDYVNRLLDDIGTKGVFLTAGCDAPANAKFENMVAMFKAGAEYK